MSVCSCFIWFVVYSFFGWVYESTYCTINERRWENRGFLYGPVCPIYGTGIIVMILVWQMALDHGEVMTWWQVFLFSFFGSAVMEYVTHWTLEKLFHAYWWDYSNMPFNLNGRICLPASTLFGLCGLLVVYVLFQPTIEISEHASIATSELLALSCAALLAADIAITVSSLKRFARAASAINRSVNAHMDQFVAGAVARGEAAAQGLEERKTGAAQALAGTVESIKETGASVTESIQVRSTAAADAISRERSQFAASLRDSWLGNMGHVARDAARRAKGIIPFGRTPDGKDEEQLRSMLSDVKARHWPHE